MQVGTQIGLQLAFRIEIDIRIGKGRGLRFLELDVDLSCDALIAVLYRRRTLRNLNALHPRSGDVTQRIRCSCPSIVGNVFSHHLYIGTAQSQQLYLLGSRGCVSIVHVYGGVRCKAFSEIAASRPQQIAAADEVSITQTFGFRMKMAMGRYVDLL